LILAALEKALRQGDGLPLFGSEGLFPARTSATRAALERCRRDRLLEESHDGNARLTDVGIDYLLERTPPDNAAGLLRECIRREEDRLRALEGEVTAARERVGQWHDRLARLGRDELKSAPPATERDYSFQRTLVQQVVFAWEETLGTEANEPIERGCSTRASSRWADPASGFRSWQGTTTATRALPGETVEVIRSGWLLRDDRGESVLALARVRRLSAP
jgi:hypothetical protein